MASKMRILLVSALTACVTLSGCGDDAVETPDGEAGAGGDEGTSTAGRGGSAGTGAGGSAGTPGKPDGGEGGSGEQPVGGMSGTGGSDAHAGEGGVAGAGIGGEGGSGSPPACTQPAPLGSGNKVRLINAISSGDAPNVDTPSAAMTLSLFANEAQLGDTVAPHQAQGLAGAYVDLPAGLAAVTFSVKSGEFTATAEPIVPEAGVRYSVVALGEGEYVQLFVVAEKFTEPSCEQVRLRFINDGFDDTISFFVGDEQDSAADVDPFSVSDDQEGVAAPTATSNVVLRPASPGTLGDTGKVRYTLPPGTLLPGRSYFAIQQGRALRRRQDAYSHSLLLVPAGDDTPPTRVLTDPIVYFYHASPAPTPEELVIKQGGENFAFNLKYASDATYQDLPPAGMTLQFANTEANGGAVVLDNQVTGPLERGAVYVGVLFGASGETGTNVLRLKLFPFRPYLFGDDQEPLSKMVFVNAAVHAPTLDVGSWPVNEDDSMGAPFSGTLPGIGYGTSSNGSGTPFPLPTNPFKHGVWLGLKNGAAFRNCFAGVPSLGYGSRWFGLLLGDWNGAAGTEAQFKIFAQLGTQGTGQVGPNYVMTGCSVPKP